MQQNGQTRLTIDPDLVQRPIFVLSERHQPGEGHWHRHQRAQFIHAAEGVITVRTAAGLWVVPPQRAVWILPGEAHRVSATQSFALRTLYAEPSLVELPTDCCVVGVHALLGALLAEAAGYDPHAMPSDAEDRLMRVVVDRLSDLQVVDAHLPSPRDPRLLKLTAQLETHPADARTLESLAAVSGMSARTAARLFVSETGLTFAQWRQQLRLLKAFEGLNAGHSIARVALDVGYADTSSFIAVFKEAFGRTPARYFRAD